MSMRERIREGKLFTDYCEGLPEDRVNCKKRMAVFNQTQPDHPKERAAALSGLLQKPVEAWVEPPFYCCYGYNIRLGKNSYINFNCNFVDDGQITIGEKVMIGPAVTIATVGHPVHPDMREYMYTNPVTIGDNCWIGAGVTICPGVTIGENTVIGAGSVVTKDIPADSVAAGNPCRVIRRISERDTRYYYKNREISQSDLEEERKLRQQTGRKIIFLDVDGTLINYEAKTPESAKEAVEKARANGHRIYICTGCSKYEIMQRDLPEIDGMICGNGAYVEDQGVVVMHHGLTREEVKAIVDWCNARNLGFYLEANLGMYCNTAMLEQGPEVMVKYAYGKGADRQKAEEMAKSFLGSFTLLEGNDLYREDVNKISYILSSYQDFVDCKAAFPELIAGTWGGKGEAMLFGDLSPEGITKKQAIDTLLEYRNANVSDTISFGDAKIDLSMFELCAYNVAMGNGGEEIKAAADYVTDDVDEDGLYHAFQYLNLL